MAVTDERDFDDVDDPYVAALLMAGVITREQAATMLRELQWRAAAPYGGEHAGTPPGLPESGR